VVVYKLYGVITGVIRPISSRPTHEGHLHKQHRRTFCYDIILILQELPKKKHFEKKLWTNRQRYTVTDTSIDNKSCYSPVRMWVA